MKAVYTARGDGLGTRMLSALYARILAEHLGLPLKVIWAPLGGASIYADYGLITRISSWISSPIGPCSATRIQASAA